MTKRFYILTFAVLLLIVSTGIFNQAAKADPSTPEEVTSNTRWEGGKALTNATNTPVAAIQPAIATAPGGKTIIVAYMKQTGQIDEPNNADPFYVRSTNNGLTWSQPAKIYQNSTMETRFLDVLIDSSSNGHAVWTENSVQLWYGKESQWSTNASSAIHSIPSTPGNLLESPKLASNGTNKLHIVWSQQESFDADIYHMSSSNGGNTWSTPSAIVNDGTVNSVSPSITSDDSGKLHVVWEAQISSFPIQAEIFYSQSSNNGVSWTTPITVSAAINPGSVDHVFSQPKIVANGNNLLVAFENRPDNLEQKAFVVNCASGCTNINNWSGDDVTVQNYSVKNTDPAFLKPQPAVLNGCAIVLFSGINGDPGTNDERIRESNGCMNWNSNPTVSGVDAVMGGNIRAIRPSVETHDNWWLYLAFERKSTTRSDIYFVRNIPGLYLPLIARQ